MIDFEELKGKIKGPSVLMMAAFKDNYELNIEALKKNIQFVIDAGITKGKGHIICPCGTGEYVTLTPEEHRMMVEAAMEVAGDKVPVLAGVQSCDYRQAIKLANSAAEAGVEGVMIPPPYYFPISQESVYRWYKTIAEGIDIGIMCYAQPWRNIGAIISTPLMSRLAEIENIVSMKYQCADTAFMGDYINNLKLYSERFSFIDNSRTSTTTIAHMHGAAGYIASPVYPSFDVKYWDLLEQHKYKEAEDWRNETGTRYIFQKFSRDRSLFDAATVKAALDYIGLYGGPVRPPFVDLTEEQREELFSMLEAKGIPAES